jgi:hypothetical protein
MESIKDNISEEQLLGYVDEIRENWIEREK